MKALVRVNNINDNKNIKRNVKVGKINVRILGNDITEGVEGAERGEGG